MSVSTFLIFIAIILFVLAALGVAIPGVNLIYWGLAAFAAAHLKQL